MDLVKILNQPPICGKVPLNMKKHQISTSYLLIELQLRCLDESAQAAATQLTGISAPPVCETLFSCISAAQTSDMRDSSQTATESAESMEGPADDDADVLSSKSEVGGLFSSWF
jgi:hypothetical protein